MTVNWKLSHDHTEELKALEIGLESTVDTFTKHIAALTDGLDVLKERLDKLEDKSAESDPAAPVLSLSDDPQETKLELPDKESVQLAIKEEVEKTISESVKKAVNKIMGRVED